MKFLLYFALRKRFSPYFAVMKESLFFLKKGVNGIFYQKKFVMSLFRIIFASGNGRALASLGFVIPECLRSAFALGLLPKMDARRIQNGRKQTSTSPMLLSDEPKE